MNLLLSKEQIADRVASLGREISEDYSGKNLHLVGVLKGSFVFLADLVRQITIPVSVDFVRLKSYEGTTKLSAEVSLESSDTMRDKHVLLVDDILDSGHTLSHLLTYFSVLGAKVVGVCVLLEKEVEHEVSAKYVGFKVPNVWVVGYGLDLSEQYRQLPDVWQA